MATNSEIGRRIKERRESLNYTLSDVAKRVGVASSTIQRYEAGNVEKLKLPVVEAIAKALNVDPAWVLFKKDTPDIDESNASGEKVDTVAKRIQIALDKKRMKQADLVAATGIGKSSISTYLSGEYEPKQRNIYKIAKALDVSESWLMGYDTPMERVSSVDDSKPDIFSISNITPLPKTYRVPRLGTIACGEPILATQNYDEYDEAPESIHCDFSLKCKGNSMIGARIHDGDIVYIRMQPDVETGEIAAVLIDECTEIAEATLKRVYKYPDQIVLQAENPEFAPLVYIREDMNKVRIIGKAVGFTSIIK